MQYLSDRTPFPPLLLLLTGYPLVAVMYYSACFYVKGRFSNREQPIWIPNVGRRLHGVVLVFRIYMTTTFENWLSKRPLPLPPFLSSSWTKGINDRLWYFINDFFLSLFFVSFYLSRRNLHLDRLELKIFIIYLEKKCLPQQDKFLDIIIFIEDRKVLKFNFPKL